MADKKSNNAIWVLAAIVIIVVIIGFGLANLAANNSTNNTNNTNTTTGTGQTYNVAIQNFAFSPASMTIHAGDTVVWTNMDSTAHTVTSDSGSELASQSIGNGQTYSHTFNTAGTYTYHCSIHPSMHGTITVV